MFMLWTYFDIELLFYLSQWTYVQSLLNARAMYMSTEAVQILAGSVHMSQGQLVEATKKVESHQNELGMGAKRIQWLER